MLLNKLLILCNQNLNVMNICYSYYVNVHLFSLVGKSCLQSMQRPREFHGFFFYVTLLHVSFSRVLLGFESKVLN